jgi:hypothetical protein
VVAVSLAQLAKDRSSDVRLQAVNQKERQELMQSGKKIRDFGSERQKLEAHEAKAGAKPAKDTEPVRGKLSKSPIAAAGAQNLDKSEAPPEPHKAPQPDPSAEPGKSKSGNRAAPGATRPGLEPRTDVPKGESPKVEPKPKKDEPPKGPGAKPETPKAGPPAPGQPPAKPQPKPQPPPTKKPGPEPKPEPKPDPDKKPK